jgi:hypothetical protein
VYEPNFRDAVRAVDEENIVDVEERLELVDDGLREDIDELPVRAVRVDVDILPEDRRELGDDPGGTADDADDLGE